MMPRLVCMIIALCLAAAPGIAQDDPWRYDQGPGWTREAREAFYRRDQGSRLIPMAWLSALRGPDGRPFLQDGLSRYGYLGQPGAVGLPVGFTAGPWQGVQHAGMTCAACHTRQIKVGTAEYRIDGGPALADFQAFLQDLDAAMLRVLSDPAAFDAFAAAIDPAHAAAADAALRTAVQAWFRPFHLLMQRSLPTPPTGQPWGPGRLDAVGMILNRLTGLDIGAGPDGIIESNMRPAAAPARYPFLWNVSVQDRTDWPGFADNGDDLLALARNLGEVYGVFAEFRPHPYWFGAGMNYRGTNSADFKGLDELESLVRRIGPPRFPGPIDAGLAAAGEQVWLRDTPQEKSCAACHGIRPGKTRLFGRKTWDTPLVDVGTDSREWGLLTWDADTGVLEGAFIPFLSNQRLAKRDLSFNILKTSVLGAILEEKDPLAIGRSGAAPLGIEGSLAGAFHLPAAAERIGGPFPYEARVLQGVWAVAPYLHNGSVPTLADLLEPPERRPAAFRIGPNYDLQRVGLARDQAPGPALTTTGCEARASGNSRCGHLYGTTLPPADKRALLEFMKGL